MSSSDDNIRGNEGPTAHEASTNPTGEHDLVGELAYKAHVQLMSFTLVDVFYLDQHQCRQQFYHLRCAEGCVQALRTLRRGILQSIKLEEMQNLSELTISSQPWTKARHI